jgi:DNA mismatch endonuclease (patch repair protein)
MADIFSRKKRSQIMSRVKGRGNLLTELRLVAIFRAHKISGWRRNARIFGKPDFIFPKRRLAVFVDGCFWHGCPMHGSIPKTNRAFWTAKLERNRQRDKEVAKELKSQGWRTVRIWQHELPQAGKIVRRFQRVLH